MTWDARTAAWWSEELAADPSYRSDVDPLLLEILPDEDPDLVLDLGCGDGRLAATLPRLFGIDRSLELVAFAASVMPACVADAIRLPIAAESVAGAVAVLVLEHVADARAFFAEAGRVVRHGGFLTVVANHPLYTVPGSGPLLDPDDGEILWRWGEYLVEGHSDEPAGEGTVRFHHRPMGHLLSVAAAAGWELEILVERPLRPGDDPLLAIQTQVPRLLGARWRR